MPCCFHAADAGIGANSTTSTAWTLLAYSWPMRWNTRSAPVRSTLHVDAGNFASNAAIFSATESSIEVYQTTLPSFFAASISAA